jgi:hypothetical protein
VTGSCKGFTPALRPNSLGSSIFIYSSDAVKDFRQEVLTSFFTRKHAAIAMAPNVFFANITALLDGQLVATLTYLPPANAVSQFSIAISTSARLPLMSFSSALMDSNSNGLIAFSLSLFLIHVSF